jgi:hypothetical protein
MDLAEKLIKKIETLRKPNGELKNSDELITELMEGKNLVDGKQTWEHAKDKKHDLECVKKCCEAEMNYLGAEPTRYLSDFNLLLFPTQRVGELNHL